MGCDIHPFILYKYPLAPNRHWREPRKRCQLWPVELTRDYVLFSYMADVRNYYADHKLDGFKPKGINIPDTEHYVISSAINKWSDEDDERIKINWDDPDSTDLGDWHSASWLDVNELKEVQKRYAETLIEDMSDYYEIMDRPHSTEEEIAVRTKELHECFDKPKSLVPRGELPELSIVIATMEAMEKFGSDPVLFFYFDN